MVLSTLLPPAAPVTDSGSSEPPVTRESLGNYVLESIRKCNGPQLPCFNEPQILDGFWMRFGESGMEIARQAFGVHRGMWCGAPVTIQRFQAHHDDFFATPLLDEVRGARGNSE